MKFKVGDRVKIVETFSYTSRVGKVGVIHGVFMNTGYSVQFKKGGVGGYVEEDLELVTIHNSKLARNLYKNQIDYIDEVSQLIYLK